jgi:4-hydroxythreonine-4-phosphate dehydrogenase
MQPNTLIVADDLSGAADCAIAFRTRGEVVIGFGEMGIQTNTLAIDADTRRRKAGEAAEIVASLFCAHRRPGTLFFKKIDSTLRGHIGVEVAAARDALADFDPLVVVSPAFPATGRTMIGGRLFVHGVPLEKTEFGAELSDGGDLTKQLKRAGLDVAHLDLRSLRDGALPNSSVLLCDAETSTDLRHLVPIVRRSGRTVLWVGSGGLARVLAGNASGDADVIPKVMGQILFLVGSQNEISHIQARRLSNFANITQLSVQSLLTERAFVPDIAGDQVVMMEREAHRDSRALVQAFAKVGVEAARKADAIFLTGGETARAVLDGLGVHALRLFGEIEPGLIVSSAEGGEIAGRTIITKAGAFGTPQALRRVQRVLRGRRQP